MSYDDYAYSLGKSLKLRLERGIGFEEIISLIEMGKLIEVVSNPSEKYPNQFELSLLRRSSLKCLHQHGFCFC